MVGHDEDTRVKVDHHQDREDELEECGAGGEVLRGPVGAPTGSLVGVLLAAGIAHLHQGKGAVHPSHGAADTTREGALQVELADDATKGGGHREQPHEKNGHRHQPFRPPLVPVDADDAEVALCGHL